MVVYYIAHPLGTGETRKENLAKVKRWLAWLMKKYPDVAFCLPWTAMAEACGDTPEDHERGLRDDLEILERCDGLVLVGGHMSPGMRVEYWHFREVKGHEVCADEWPHLIMNLLHLGSEPPNEM